MTIVVTPTTNTLDGGAGIDSATYAGAASAVTADLATGTASGPAIDTLTDIESISGSNLADSLTGESRHNLINGRSGDDFLDGGAGRDPLNGGAGTDTCINGEKLTACEGTGTQPISALASIGLGVGFIQRSPDAQKG